MAEAQVVASKPNGPASSGVLRVVTKDRWSLGSRGGGDGLQWGETGRSIKKIFIIIN